MPNFDSRRDERAVREQLYADAPPVPPQSALVGCAAVLILTGSDEQLVKELMDAARQKDQTNAPPLFFRAVHVLVELNGALSDAMASHAMAQASCSFPNKPDSFEHAWPALWAAMKVAVKDLDGEARKTAEALVTDIGDGILRGGSGPMLEGWLVDAVKVFAPQRAGELKEGWRESLRLEPIAELTPQSNIILCEAFNRALKMVNHIDQIVGLSEFSWFR